MTIIFDEVTGTVEPRDAAAQDDQLLPTRPDERPDAGVDESTLERSLRRRVWLEARRRAD